MLVSVGSKAYIHHFGTYNLTYGSLGAVIVLLLVFYLSGVTVLSGGVLNAVLERGRLQESVPAHAQSTSSEK